MLARTTHTQPRFSAARSLTRTPRPARVVFGSQRSQTFVVVKGLGNEVVDGWMDMAKLVSGGGGNKSPYDELAGAIGRDVYVDIQGWHLYLRDMTAVPGFKMSQALAQQLGPQVSRGLREADIEAVLKKVPIKLGSGKMKVSLYDVMPSMCVGDLVKILGEYGRR